jgi:hypothetical protein
MSYSIEVLYERQDRVCYLSQKDRLGRDSGTSQSKAQGILMSSALSRLYMCLNHSLDPQASPCWHVMASDALYQHL